MPLILFPFNPILFLYSQANTNLLITLLFIIYIMSKYLYNAQQQDDHEKQQRIDEREEIQNINIHQTILKLFNYNKGLNDGLQEVEVKAICYQSRDIMIHQSPLLDIHSPLKIIGNIHGQFQDLLKIFDYTGQPGDVNYVFLGDYVDRGKESVATIALLLAYKIKYPQNLFLLRGNHESSFVNRIYGFYDECKRKYSLKIWKLFCDVFNVMPYAAVIEEKIFCVHGGISPELDCLEKIKKIQRPTQIPKQGLVCDLVWSDPDPEVSYFDDNVRGISYGYGEESVNKFLKDTGLELIVRSHQVVEDGYEFNFKKKVLTLFSAPNFDGHFDNNAGILRVDDSLTCSFQIYKPKKLTTKHKMVSYQNP